MTRAANLNAFHNTIRKLYNIEWAQLDFLSDAQKDNFFDNPPRFFISADDETAEKLWGVMFPKPPEAKAGVVVDLDRYRKAAEGGPVIPLKRHWSPEVRIGGLPPMQTPSDFHVPGQVYPLPGSAADVPPRTYLVNGTDGTVSARAG